MLSLSVIHLPSYAQEHSDQKAVHSMAITVTIFQEKLQGSLGNHYDWIKTWKNEENLHSPFLEETWHFYSPPLNSLVASVYLCQRTTGGSKGQWDKDWGDSSGKVWLSRLPSSWGVHQIPHKLGTDRLMRSGLPWLCASRDPVEAEESRPELTPAQLTVTTIHRQQYLTGWAVRSLWFKTTGTYALCLCVECRNLILLENQATNV